MVHGVGGHFHLLGTSTRATRLLSFRNGPAMYGIHPDTDFSFLIGRRLGEIGIGPYQFGLIFDGDVYIAMQNEFAVSADPADVPERHQATAACVSGIAPLVKLIGQSITAVSVDRSGEEHALVLRFGESFLTLYDSGSDKGFESFHINTPDYVIVV